MYLLNGRLVFEVVEFHDDWVVEEPNLRRGHSSIIPCPASLLRFKKEWPYIKASGEPYTPQILNKLAEYSKLDFHLPEEEQVMDCLWLECYDVEEYQKVAVIEMLNRSRLAVFFDTGTGKTVITVQYLYNKLQDKKDQNILIVTKSIVVPQYQAAVDNLPDEIRNNNTITISTYDTAYKEAHRRFSIVILDESHSIKNKSSLRHQELSQIIGKGTENVFIMTATPQDKTKFEIITQLSLFSNLILHPQGGTAYKSRYWLLNDYGSPKTPIESRIHEVDDVISRLSIKCEADDVLTIPPMMEPVVIKSYLKRDMSLYETLKKKKVVEINGGRFTAPTFSSLRSGLRQISNGFIYTKVLKNPNDPIEKWQTINVAERVNTYKIDDMRKVFLKEKFESGIIFTAFDEDNRIVEELMIELGITYRSVLRLTKKKKDEMIRDFKAGVFSHLIIKATAGGVGLDFQHTNTIHWYSMPEGWIDLKQGRGRVHRRGQTRVQREYIYLGSELDRNIYRNVAVKKKNYSDETFSHFLDMSNEKTKKEE